MYWFENPEDPVAGDWIQHTIDGSIVHPECLAVADLDRDGDDDVVTCDLDFDRWSEQVNNVYVFENRGKVDEWTRWNVAPNSFASHLLRLVDIDQDGALDIISECTGCNIVSYYRNLSTPSNPAERNADGQAEVPARR